MTLQSLITIVELYKIVHRTLCSKFAHQHRCLRRDAPRPLRRVDLLPLLLLLVRQVRPGERVSIRIRFRRRLRFGPEWWRLLFDDHGRVGGGFFWFRRHLGSAKVFVELVTKILPFFCLHFDTAFSYLQVEGNRTYRPPTSCPIYHAANQLLGTVNKIL